MSQVYFITDGEYTKIGHTVSPRDRLTSLQTGNPRTLTLIALFDGGVELESKFHRAFADRAIGGEWFALNASEIKRIACQYGLDIDVSRVPASVEVIVEEHTKQGSIMRQYGPSKRNDGKFDYTCKNHMQVWAIGFCQGWENIPESKRENMGMSDKFYERLLANKSRFHEDGHDTPEEAIDCYREYQLDVLTDYEAELKDTKKKCEVCGEWTQGVARVKQVNEEIVLCDEHRTRHVVNELLPEQSYRTEPEQR